METITIPVFNMQGKETDTVSINASLFEDSVNQAAIYQAINAYRANQRKGLASTKTRGEVSGGGKKPWKQKGTGRARVGSIRSPLWRHGGVVFGPHPRDFSYVLPKKIRIVALKSVVFGKIQTNNIIVVDNFAIDSAKTKDAAKIFSNFKLNQKKNNILVLDKIEAAVRRPLRNLSYLALNLAKDTNVYEIITADKLIINKDGLNVLLKRLK